MADQLTGIHLGTETLSVITLRRGKKQWIPVGGALHLLTTAEQEDPAGAVKAAVKAAHHGRGSVMLSLPKQHAILRKALLPSIDAAELAQMARFEAERHIPLHPERHATGFHILRSMGVEGSEVLLGAVDGPIVEKALKSAAVAGLTPDGLTLSSIGLVNTLLYCKREWVQGRTIAILSIGLETLDLVLMSEGRVLMARSVQMDLRGVLEAWLGIKAGTEPIENLRPDVARLALAARMIDCQNLGVAAGHHAESVSSDAAPLVEGWMERIVQELRRTYDFARREVKCPPVEALVLTGEGASLRNLDQFLLTHLEAELVMLNPFEGMPEAAALKFPFGGLEFSIPFGAAVAREIETGYRLDLIPPEYHRTQSRKSTYRRLATTGVLLLVAAGLMAASYMRFEDFRARELQAYDDRITEMKPQVGDLLEMKTKLGLIRNFLNDPNSALLVLNTLTSSSEIPDALSLSKIDYVKGNIVTVDGEAKEVTNINKYNSEMQATGHFTDVHPLEQHPINQYGQQWYQFKMEAPLKQSSVAPKAARGGGGGQ